MDALERWLDEHGLSAHAETLRAQQIDMDVLEHLTEQHLTELGLPLGDRIRFLKAVAALGVAEDGPAAGARAGPKSPEPIRSEGERRQLTVMFCDLVGSTALSGELDLEDYRELIRVYQHTVATILTRHGGYIARYLGDGVLVYFGYPVASEDDAGHAILAALEVVPAVSRIAFGDGRFASCRLGIATGTVVVGDVIGESESRERAVVGVTPNLAARLQGEAPPDGIMISALTHQLTEGRFDVEFHGDRELKGIAGRTPVISVLGERDVTHAEARSASHTEALVGREAEMALLSRQWAETCEGKGGGILLVGEAGIGKSRLVEQQAADAALVGNVMRCSCSPQHTNTELYSVVRAFRKAGELSDDDEPEQRRSKLEVLFQNTERRSLVHLDLFCRLLSPEDDAGGSAGENFVDAICSALIDYVAWIAERAPSLIVFEDVHWADPTTRLLIERVSRRAMSSRLMVLVTARPGYEGSARDSVLRVLRLNRLTDEASAALVRDLLTDAGVSGEVVETIVRRADGVPLFAEQLARSVRGGVQDASAIPTTLRDSLTARLDRLGEGRAVAQVAAAIGREFSFRLLQHVLDTEADLLEMRLTELEEASIVSPRGVGGKGSYEFRHGLLRDAAYDGLLRERRRDIHGRIAEQLVEMDEAGAESGVIAHHFEAAQEFRKAAEHWEIAGRRSRRRSAHVEATAQFEQAIGLLRHEEEPERSEMGLRLRLELGGQLIACHGNGAREVEDNYEAAIALLPRVRDQELAFRAQHGMRTFYMVRGPLSRARELGVALLELAGELNDRTLALQAHRPHGLTLFAMGELEPARSHLEWAIELYDPAVHGSQRFEYISDPLVLARCNLGWALAFLGDAEGAVHQCETAVDLARELNHDHSLAFALSLAASTHQALGDVAATRAVAASAVELSGERGYPYWLAWNRMLVDWCRAADGEDVESSFNEGLEAYAATDARMMQPYFLTLYAETRRAAGRPGDALTALGRARDMADITGTRFYLTELYRLRAAALADLGEAPSRVRESLSDGERIAEDQGNQLLRERLSETLRDTLGPQADRSVG